MHMSHGLDLSAFAACESASGRASTKQSSACDVQAMSIVAAKKLCRLLWLCAALSEVLGGRVLDPAQGQGQLTSNNRRPYVFAVCAAI